MDQIEHLLVRLFCARTSYTDILKAGRNPGKSDYIREQVCHVAVLSTGVTLIHSAVYTVPDVTSQSGRMTSVNSKISQY